MTNSVQAIALHSGVGSAVASKLQETQSVTPATNKVPFELRYSSPVINMDSQTGLAILQFRDSTTGKETYQIPSKAALTYDQVQSKSAVEPVQSGSESNGTSNSKE